MLEIMKNEGLGSFRPDDKDAIFKKWNGLGFTYSLDEEHSFAVCQLFEEAARILVNQTNHVDNQTEILAFPAVRRIYSACAGLGEMDPLHTYIGGDDEQRRTLQTKLVGMIDIQSMLHRLDIFVRGFMKIAPLHLPHVDDEAELLCLFCHNEVAGMYKEAKKS